MSETIEFFPLADLLTDGMQMRADISQELIDEMADVLIDPEAQLPPGVAYFDGNVLWIADGIHRHAAHHQASRDKMPVEIRKGSQRDAILFAVGANANHGLRRTQADKRKAVMVLLSDEVWSEASDRWIASQCSVNHELVGKLRSVGVSANTTEETKYQEGRDGRIYKAKKSRSGQSRKAKPTSTGPAFCERCTRIGPVKDCPKCAALHKKKPGSEVFDWKELDQQFGAIADTPERIAGAYPREKNSSNFHAAQRILNSFITLIKDWKKDILKGK